MKKVIVRLPYVTEEIYIGQKIEKSISEKIRSQEYDHILVLVDARILAKHKKKIRNLLSGCHIDQEISIQPIPSRKSFQYSDALIRLLLKHKFTRRSCIVAIGGGYVADIAGFIASIYMRGIEFIQIPTTLMAMGDSIIGKVAVNFDGYKNLIGNFYSPRFVFCDTEFLKTLPTEESAYGLVEIWKHAILKNNRNYVGEIEAYLKKPSALKAEDLIHFSLVTKGRYVKSDFNDRNGRHKAVSLGHTFANYFERCFAMRHGESVFYGIIIATLLSEKLGYISQKKKRGLLTTASHFESVIKRLESVQSKINPKDALKGIAFDKINHHNSYTFVLPTNKGYIVKPGIAKDDLAEVLKSFKKLVL